MTSCTALPGALARTRTPAPADSKDLPGVYQPSLPAYPDASLGPPPAPSRARPPDLKARPTARPHDAAASARLRGSRVNLGVRALWGGAAEEAAPKGRNRREAASGRTGAPAPAARSISVQDGLPLRPASDARTPLHASDRAPETAPSELRDDARRQSPDRVTIRRCRPARLAIWYVRNVKPGHDGAGRRVDALCTDSSGIACGLESPDALGANARMRAYSPNVVVWKSPALSTNGAPAGTARCRRRASGVRRDDGSAVS
jgi:hypothetical protein